MELSLEELLKADQTCEVIRVILACPSGVRPAGIAEKLGITIEQTAPVISSLVTLGILRTSGELLQMSAPLASLPAVKAAVIEYEKIKIQERVKNFTVDIPARLKVTGALQEMIEHARSKLK